MSFFFEQDTQCPNCNQQIKTRKVKSSKCIVQHRETDFNLIYQDINPTWYAVWVCPQCHYAALTDNFASPLLPHEKPRVAKGLELLKRPEPDFLGERGPTEGLRSYELAIQTAQLKHAAPEIFAGLFLRAAWLCRELKQTELEQTYLKEALRYYVETYQAGHNADSYLRQMYLIGELHRRLGMYNQAVQWFSRLVSLPEVKEEPLINRLAREQWILAKEEAKKAKEDAKNTKEETVINPETSPPAKNPESGAQISHQAATAQAAAASEPCTSTLPPRQRPRAKANLSLYLDQLDWLKNVVTSIHGKSGVLVEKEAVLRSLLDALMEVQPDFSACTTEEDIKKVVLNHLK